MRRLAAGLIGVSVIATLSACGSSSPRSIEDLSDVIEEMGYECDEPTAEDSHESVDCGKEIYASWHESAADEVASFDAVSSVYEGIPGNYSVELYVIRGKQWRISGNQGAITKVAESLNKDMDMISN